MDDIKLIKLNRKVDNNKESSIHLHVAKWLTDNGLLFCHIPNGFVNNPIRWKIACSRGASAGVPDLLIFSKPPKFPECRGVALELKVSAPVTKNQQEWHTRLRENGWKVCVAYTYSETIRFLLDLGY